MTRGEGPKGKDQRGRLTRRKGPDGTPDQIGSLTRGERPEGKNPMGRARGEAWPEGKLDQRVRTRGERPEGNNQRGTTRGEETREPFDQTLYQPTKRAII